MLAWAACALATSLALGIAALLAEQACRLRQLPTRGCWIAALALSVLLPLAAPLIPPATTGLPGLAGLATAGHPPTAAHAAARGARDPARGARDLARTTLARDAQLSAVLPALAAALSAAMLGSLALASLRLHRRARRWRHARIAGLDVLLAPEAGPAVFGWWRPRVVLPEWLGREATRARGLALEHERSHLQARDPQLLAASLLLLAAMPWCPPMWWQLRRLRGAIEVDCVRRVLRAGGDLVDYCETLIALGQQRGAQRGLMAAVPGTQSLLERRIRIMSARPFPWSRSAAIACTTLAVALATGAVALATELAPTRPTALSAPPAPPAAFAALPAPPALPAQPALHAPPAPPAPPVAAPAPPAPPAAPVRSRKHADEQRAATEQETPEARALEDAKREAEEAQERADEAKAQAEEAEQDALEAKRDAEQQAADAEQAKREAEQQATDAQAAKRAAEAAAAEAAARKQDVENAQRAQHSATN